MAESGCSGSVGKTASLHPPPAPPREFPPGDLKPATEYFYIVGDESYGWTKEVSFRTAPDVLSPISFVAFGDQGTTSWEIDRSFEHSWDFIEDHGEVPVGNTTASFTSAQPSHRMFQEHMNTNILQIAAETGPRSLRITAAALRETTAARRASQAPLAHSCDRMGFFRCALPRYLMNLTVTCMNISSFPPSSSTRGLPPGYLNPENETISSTSSLSLCSNFRPGCRPHPLRRRSPLWTV